MAGACHLVSILSLLLSLSSAVDGYSNITLATTLSPHGQTRSWPSPSGDFAFGFRAIDTDPTLFLLAVWLDKDPNTTVVWCANGDAPVGVASTAKLHDNRLSLTDQTGREVWSATAANTSYAAMLDTGNLVLASANSESLWQSFDSPTDTILPTQVLGVGGQLFARLADDDYSRGRFQLLLQNDGNLSFFFIAIPTGFRYDSYWASNTKGDHYQLVFDQPSSSTILTQSDGVTVYNLTSATFITGDYYQRATLDPDGIFRHYSLSKDVAGGSWEVQDSAATQICGTVPTQIGSGVCGFNSYCSLDVGGRVDCKCPPRYSFVDPTKKYKGCVRDFPAQNCADGGEAAYEMRELTNVDWPLNAAEELSPMNESECRSNCLRDCFCVVAVYKTNTCWKKRHPLSNGRDGGDVGRVAFVKVSNLNTSYSSETRCDKHTWVLIGSLLLGCSVLLNFAQITACSYIRAKRPIQDRALVSPESALRSFSYKELEQATAGFSEQIGRGAFGTVYKGTLVMPGGCSTLVAVKKLNTHLDEAAEKDLANEIRSIGQTHHKNLVHLYGFCKEGPHRLLVYEYMSNGSLNTVLFGREKPSWSQRVSIAKEIASGLAYLHEECRAQIIHCDIKPHNILLDDNLSARISDFGLAKLLGMQQTRTSTGVRGTIGYFAPEWFKNAAITTKVDVYSYGVLLLEILCCRRNLEWEQAESNEEKMVLMDWAKDCYRNGKVESLIEDCEKVDAMMLERLVMVTISCVQTEAGMRPSMRKVVQMLDGDVSVPVPPNAYMLD